MNEEEKIYCSLDIETSGFDPLTNEILEVGFVMFEVKDGGFKIKEEWTQVFKPAKPVSSQIFGLTGITQKELDEAPQFSEYKDVLQKKLGQAVIVGHNIVFDTKFLEAFGLKFSGQVIDTLDLVQWILPSHHSYNLENLMHSFNISHKEAHRALADSKATLKLLEKLLQVYSSFPNLLKDQIQKLIEPCNFIWKDFLPINFKPLVFDNTKQQKLIETKAKTIKIQPNTVYNFSLDDDYQHLLTQANNKKVLLVVPKAYMALELQRQVKSSAAVFLPQWQLDEKKFAAWLNKANLSEDEVKFLLKLLVWKYTNWQTQALLDLNLSFFGGQFKAEVSGGKIDKSSPAKTVICDMETFLYLSENGLYEDRNVIISGLSQFESAVTANIGTKASWGYISYLFKSFYNPELKTGQEKFSHVVEEALLATDLFFGLVSALLQTDPPGFLYFKISANEENEERYVKIKTAGRNYLEKITALNEIFNSADIKKFVESLEEFFQSQDNRVKWIEISETRCAFLNMPLDITGLVNKVFSPFSAISFADSLDDNILPKFFLKRLGLGKFKIVTINSNPELSDKTSKQGDLFLSAKKGDVKKRHNINYHCLDKTIDFLQIIEILQQQALPAAVLFASPVQVRQFYEQHYQQLKSKASLLVQSGSGGSNKIFRNFSINSNSLLLATDKFIVKALSPAMGVDPVNKLSVKTLILCRLPFEQFTHPYQEALSSALPNPFEDYALPRALYNFHSIIKFFYSPELQDVFIIDPKLNKGYASVFREYYKTLPNADLVK